LFSEIVAEELNLEIVAEELNLEIVVEQYGHALKIFAEELNLDGLIPRAKSEKLPGGKRSV
jgi:hypothetical protein